MSKINLNSTGESVDERITALTEGIARAAAGVDSLNNKLTFTANGEFTFATTGTAGESFGGTEALNLGYAPIYLAYYNLSTEPGIWRDMNDLQLTTGGVAEYDIRVQTRTLGIDYNWSTLLARAACTVRIKWFLLKEPAQTV